MNLDLNDLILVIHITKFDISTVIKCFRNNTFNNLYNRFYYAKYEFGFSLDKSCQINIIRFNFNRLNNEYKLYFNGK